MSDMLMHPWSHVDHRAHQWQGSSCSRGNSCPAQEHSAPPQGLTLSPPEQQSVEMRVMIMMMIMMMPMMVIMLVIVMMFDCQGGGLPDPAH